MPKQITTLMSEQSANPMLAPLKEINAPADISWWPQTLGWQLLLAAFCTYLLYRVALLVRRYRNNAYRRAALVELTNINIKQSELVLMPQILRSTALYAFERQQVSPLIGTEWEQWLDEQCQGTDFAGYFKGMLDQLAFSPKPNLSSEQLTELKSQVLFWVKNHRGKYD